MNHINMHEGIKGKNGSYAYLRRTDSENSKEIVSWTATPIFGSCDDMSDVNIHRRRLYTMEAIAESVSV